MTAISMQLTADEALKQQQTEQIAAALQGLERFEEQRGGGGDRQSVEPGDPGRLKGLPLSNNPRSVRKWDTVWNTPSSDLHGLKQPP